MQLTSLDAGRRQLCAAIRMFFGGDDPVAIHSLACNAREIFERTCTARGLQRLADYAIAAHPNLTSTQTLRVLNHARTFFKHSKEGVLDFKEEYNDAALLFASRDCELLLGEAAPMEVQVFMAWKLASDENLPAVPPEFQVLKISDRWADLRTASREVKLQVGRDLLAFHLKSD